MSSANVWCMCADESSPHVSPFTRTDIRVRAVELVGRDDAGPKNVRPVPVLGFGGAHADRELTHLGVAADMSFQIVHPKT